MKILISCIVPLFPHYVMGGAQKHLRYIAEYLAELGHEVTILCTYRYDTPQMFQWHPRVTVKPVLRFKQPFPQPYAVPAMDMAAAVQDVGEHLQEADRFYMHDGEFLFPFVYKNVPAVVSLRDNVYPETLLGSFLFQGHTLILISHYARQYFEQTAGRFFPDLKNRIRVIRNGLDWNRYKPTPPDRIVARIPVNPAEDQIILHPHRPEESKGLWQTIDVVDLLVHRYGFNKIKTLVPRWIGLEIDPDVQNFYQRAQKEIGERGLEHHFIFHDWIPYELLPEYYSLGSLSLSLGNFVESFGNAVYESLGCGTPSVVARISSHRELLPEELIDKVDFGDAEQAAEKAAAILSTRRRTSEETLAYLHEHYAVEKQLPLYAEAIVNAIPAQELVYQLHRIDEKTRFRLPVWCYISTQGIYHDFRADYQKLPALQTLLQHHPQGFTFAQSATLGVEAETVRGWYRDGYLTPQAP